MNAGSLAYIVPSINALPPFNDKASWSILSAQNYGRFSLPEGLCWHVLRSISRALLWLHYGVKETPGSPGDYRNHDDDWQPILIMDVSPSQIWFKKPDGRKGITYGECKLGGFQTARVTGSRMAIAEPMGNEPCFKQHYHAPVRICQTLCMPDLTIFRKYTMLPVPGPEHRRSGLSVSWFTR
jgi:hypothetical protein